MSGKSTAVASAPATVETGFEHARFILKEVPINQIRLGKYALRDVNRNSEDFLQLRDAIAATGGPLMPILVREIEDPENKGKSAYGLIDGLQRFSCCFDLGFSVIPARVIEMDDATIASAQIIANRSRIETKPVEYTKQLHRMLNADPMMTKEELADKLHCSEKWLDDRLSLSKLHSKIGPLVDEGKISLAHAYALVKLKPDDEQLAFVEQAQIQTIQEFAGHVNNRVKELRTASRAGRVPGEKAEFIPVPHIRPVREIKAQLESPTLAESICEEMEATTAAEGFKAGIAWALSMDPTSIETFRQADADRKAAAAGEKTKKDAEKLRKRAEEARKAAAAAGINVDAASAAPDDEEDDDDDDDDN